MGKSWKEAENEGKEDRRTARKVANVISEFQNEFINKDPTILKELAHER